MTAADAFEAAPCASDRAVFVDGVDHVLTARGVIATVSAHEAAQRHAVDEYKEDEQTREHEKS